MTLYELSDEQFDTLLAAYPNAALYLAGRTVEPDYEAAEGQRLHTPNDTRRIVDAAFRAVIGGKHE